MSIISALVVMARYDYLPRYGLENYTVVLPLEDTFDAVRSTAWMQQSWLHSVSFSVAYVALIYAGQKVSRVFDLHWSMTHLELILE